MPRRLLFIMGVLSPFQLDLVRGLRGLGVDARLLFNRGGIGTRPAHWSVPIPEWAVVDNIDRSPRRLRDLFDEFRPHAVVYGGYRGPVGLEAAALCRQRGVPLAYWLEQPSPTRQWRNDLRELVIARRLRGADLVMCIGPRAAEYYGRLVPDSARLHCLPYGEDLEPNVAFERAWAESGPVTFLFSGKLVQRNNIWEMLSAFRDVRARDSDARLLLSGYAGFAEEVRDAVEADVVLRAGTSWDQAFERWEDRLRPFRRADVFLLPGLHAGWGLIVPEAMSFGMPVIGSRGVESVRSLVRHGKNGLVVEPTYTDIVKAMEQLLGDRALLRGLGEQARRDAMSCDSGVLARRVIDLLRHHG